VTVLRIADF